MATHKQAVRSLPVYILGVLSGLLVAWLDVRAPWGDDSAKVVLLLWVAVTGPLGYLRPRRPWRWALVVGPWLPLTHLARHVLGMPDMIHPNTYATILLLFPVSVAACSLGAYGGALLRRVALEP
jgi:hypothetical protein